MKSIFFILSLLICFPAFSKASLVEKIENRYKDLKSWQTNFKQKTFIEPLDQTLEKEGSIIGRTPNQLRINYQTQPQKDYIYNGKNLWIFQKFNNSVIEYKNADQIISKEALSFLNGLHNLTELFNVIKNMKQPKGYYKIKGRNLEKISLVPKDQESPILRITLGIDKEKLNIKEAIIFNISGNVTHYSFSDLTLAKNINKNSFQKPNGKKIKLIKPKE